MTMQTMNRLIRSVCAAAVTSAGMATLQASAENWSVASGSFTNTANWDTGTVPTNGAWAVIDNAGTALMDGGTVMCSCLFPGYSSAGAIVQSGGSITVTAGMDPDVGVGYLATGAGTYAMSGGSLSVPNGNFQIGGRGTGSFTQTGGAVTGGGYVVIGRYGPAGNGALTVSGGEFNQSRSDRNLIVAEGGVGSLTVTNAGLVSVNGGLRISQVKNGTGDVGTGTGTVYLCRGGTISTPNVHTLGGSSTFYFDGGVLSARSSGQTYGAFMQGLSAAYVRSGGAVIDTGSNLATINQNLLDGGGAGGLTKLGTGVLTLGGANGYTGGTAVSNGVLAAVYPTSLPGYVTAGQVKVANGAGLTVGLGGSGTWTSEQMYALATGATFGTGCLFGFDTSLGSAAVSDPIDLSSLGLRLAKTGGNVLQLTGANNNAGATVYGGILQADFGAGLDSDADVTLNGGTLSSSGGSITAASGSGAGQVNVSSGAPAGFSAYGAPLNVNLGGAGASLQWGTASFNPNPLLLNDTGANASLTFVNGLNLAGGSRMVTVNATAAGATLSGALSDSVGGGSLIKSGSGNLTLLGTGSLVPNVEARAGTLVCTGGTLSVSSQLNIGLSSGNTGSLVLSNGTVLANLLYVGRGGYGAVTQTGGTLGLYGAAGSDGWRIGGWSDNTAMGTGIYTLSGGTLDTGVQNLQIGCSGIGTLNQSGGTVNCGGWAAIGRFSGGTGSFTLSGGIFNQTASGCRLIVPEAGTGTFTVKDAGVANLTGGLRLCNNAGCGAGTVYLKTGGTINTPFVERLNGTNAYMNFDGGILRANGSSTAFMTGLTSAKIGVGGALIDSNGKSITVAQGLTGSSMNASLASRLLHRWSFNGNLTDSVGGQTATTVGSVTAGGSQYTLAGGGKGASYINLGPNILPTDTSAPVTIELWATQNAVQNWSRIFDFGIDQNNTMIMSWTMGGDVNTDRVEVRSTSGTASTLVDSSMAPYTLGTEWHIAMVITPGAGTGGLTLFQWYKMDAAGNTVKSGSMSANYSPAAVAQANMWLGHSEWPDNDASASYNELRIWNAALTEAQLKENSVYGPDSALHDGGLVKLGDGTLILTGSNSYSGPTVVSNGVLRVGAANAVPTNGDVRVANGYYDLGGLTVTNRTLALESGSVVGGTLVASAFNLTGSGNVYAALKGGTLTKSGTGTVAVAGANTYTGNTVVAGGKLSLASATAGLLRHRWSFNGDLTDSVGGQTATAVGTVNASSTQYTLAGNGTRGSSYINLGSNILPMDNTTPVTIELWATQNAYQYWARIFDFGSSTSYNMMMAWYGNYTGYPSWVEMKNGGDTDAYLSRTIQTPNVYSIGAEYHIAFELVPGAGSGGVVQIRWYVMDGTGTLLNSGTMDAKNNFSLATFVQSNMWLGHSEYGADNDGNASYNEVRIWNAALSEDQLRENSWKGPDALFSLGGNNVLPTNTVVSVASGATLDLSSATQTVASVVGSGTVSNGTLSVTGTIAPGGTNVIGTLTLASTTSLTGTLLVDVAANGTCDLLQSPGALDLGGLNLVVQNPDQFARGLDYLIVKAAPGQLSGRFASASLGATKWQIVYRYAAGEVKIITRMGTAVIVR